MKAQLLKTAEPLHSSLEPGASDHVLRREWPELVANTVFNGESIPLFDYK